MIPVLGGQECPRNAPCPCKSGKKYKHCCRAAGGGSFVKRNETQNQITAAMRQVFFGAKPNPGQDISIFDENGEHGIKNGVPYP
jgi:hypothetical protein